MNNLYKISHFSPEDGIDKYSNINLNLISSIDGLNDYGRTSLKYSKIRMVNNDHFFIREKEYEKLMKFLDCENEKEKDIIKIFNDFLISESEELNMDPVDIMIGIDDMNRDMNILIIYDSAFNSKRKFILNK